jgi:transcriptional regulator with XRE-family HTH domain
MPKQPADPPRRDGDQQADETWDLWQAFGEMLEELRLDRGLRPDQLAKQAGVGRQTIIDLEHGWRKPHADMPRTLVNPTDEVLGKLARALGVPVKQFFDKVGRYAARPQTRASHRGEALRRRDDDELDERLATAERQIRQLAELAGVDLDSLQADTEPAPPPRRRPGKAG